MLMLCAVIASCNFSNNNLKIGVLKKDNAVITEDLTKLKNSWNQFLLEKIKYQEQ
jgi:hypothetical protein